MSLLTRTLLPLLLLWPCAEHALAAQRALLVGVSEYPSLPERFQLSGPRNDMARMKALLAQRGFAAADTVVLADGVEGAQGLPTRAAILAALEHLAQEARPGDQVLLYFAGHGSQEPADRSTEAGRQEPDGLFEIFLPRDVGAWTEGQGSGHVANALVDHEIRAKVEQIIGRGAFVWGIFDACHSATLVRGGNDADEIQYRHLDPAVLGIPARAMDHAQADAIKTRGGAGPEAVSTGVASPQRRQGQGGGVYFYAAQTTELAPEMRLPLGDPERRPYGLFGYTVMDGLATGLPMTYRQLGQYVLSRYGSLNQARVTPIFTGELLDEAVLGQQAPVVRQWPVTRTGADGVLTLAAGVLSRVSEGSVIALVASPLDPADKALAKAVVKKAGLNSSELALADSAGAAMPAPASLPANLYGILTQPAPQYGLKVVLDARACGKPCPHGDAISALQKEGVPGADVQWLTPPAMGDITLQVGKDHVRLLPPGLSSLQCQAVRSASERSRCEEELAASAQTLRWRPGKGPEDLQALKRQVQEGLHAVSRSVNLLKIAANLEEQARAGASRLQVSLVRMTKSGARDVLQPGQVPALADGDEVEIRMKNTGLNPVDVTLVYLDAAHGISILFPQQGSSNRLEPGAEESEVIAVNDSTTGLERLMVVAVEAQPKSERADFSFLAQPGVKWRDATVRGAGALDEDIDAFRDAGFADFKTRAADPKPKAPSSRTRMQVFHWKIQKGS